jgi:hypothetical protein
MAVELKTGYTFDTVCSGGAILLAGKYGRKHSVAYGVEARLVPRRMREIS